MTTRNLDTGKARIQTGRKTGSVVHLVRPPVGEGLVCDPRMPVDRLLFTDEAVSCGVCLRQVQSDARKVFRG